MKALLKKYPFYLLLLPVFFVLHGYINYFGRVPAKAALLLCLLYTGATILLFALLWLLYKNLQKAGLATFLITGFNFFFGPIHDLLKKISADSFLVKYSFLLPAAVVLFTILFILLKRTKKNFFQLTAYLNILFLLLIVFDTGNLLLKKNKKNAVTRANLPQGLTTCDSCAKPDIYLIVADEYANNKQLKEVLHFDNSHYESELTRRGFHVIQNSKSNYNSTPFSIASLLGMDYIDSLGDNFNDRSLNAAYTQIDQNPLTTWLQQQGYEVKNHSGFPLAGIPNPITSTFFITGTELFTMHTFIGRFNSDIRWNFITRFKIKSEIKKFVQTKLDNNQRLIDKTIATARQLDKKPRFVYLHLMMPHFPYLLDSNGKADYETSYLDNNRLDQARYLGYLQYSNKVFLSMIDDIQKASPNAIIIFMGDHGFRHMEGHEETHFMSFNSIYLPQKNYGPFYEGMSMVNEFRVLLNSSFNQQLPLLKDSTVFLKNWW